jgi:hypothetical protein
MERPGLFCIFHKVYTFGKPGFFSGGNRVFHLSPSSRYVFLFTRSHRTGFFLPARRILTFFKKLSMLSEETYIGSFALIFLQGVKA